MDIILIGQQHETVSRCFYVRGLECFEPEALSPSAVCSVPKHQAHPKLSLCYLQLQVNSALRLRADPNAVIRSRTGLISHAAPAGRLVSTRSPEMRFASRQSANTNLPAAGTRERPTPTILNTNILRHAAPNAMHARVGRLPL